MPYKIITARCSKSGLCVQECPMDAILFDENLDGFTIDPDSCTDCGSCADVCPEEAITGLED